MKSTLLILLLTISSFAISQTNNELKPCPETPNCFCSADAKKWKALPFIGTLEATRARLTEYLSAQAEYKLVASTDTYLHYEYSTNVGKYIDDVEFYFDQTKKVIQFRSASREGFSDLGANKRRMKKLSKMWLSFTK